MPTRFFEEKYKLARELLVGHDHVIKSIIEHLEIQEAGLNDPTRPIGSFLLAGPTGCGKTTIARALAHALHYNQKQFIRIDCAEYQQGHEVAKLIGAPPGYLGHRESPAILGQTQLKLKTSEHCPLTIVLFDEVEKAAPEFHNLLLGILDAGRLTLGTNEVTSFVDCIILMTSNQGVKETTTKLSYGLVPTQLTDDAKKNIISSSIGKFFSPEFRNRLDAIFILDQLTPLEAREVARYELNNVFGKAKLDVVIDDKVLDKLVDFGYSEEYGARQIKRVIETKLVRPAAKVILNGQRNKTLNITATSTGFKITTRTKAKEATT